MTAKTLTFSGLCFLLILSTCKESAPPTTTANKAVPSLESRIDELAAAALEDGPIAGFAIAVRRGDTWLVNKGYGVTDLAQQSPVQTSTIFRMASISKLFTAVAVMKLVEADKLSLDDRLGDLLPQFPNTDQGRQITLRHLLNHTSGLADYESADTERWLNEGSALTPPFVLDFLGDRPLDFEPGSRLSYCNTGFYLAGMIIEKVSKQRFGAFIRQEVLEPLDMAHSYLCDDEQFLELQTLGYEVVDGKLAPGRLYPQPGIFGDGGLCAPASDLARMPQILLSSGLLSSASVAEMMRPTVLSNGVAVDYGLGVRRGSLAGHELWGHTGGMNTYWSTLAHYPETDTTIVVLVNTDDAATDALILESEVAQVVLNLGEPDLLDRPMTEAEQAALAATYQMGGDTIQIRAQETHLTWATEGEDRPPRKLHYQGEHIFGRSDYPRDRIIFHLEDGKAIAFSEYYNGIFVHYGHRIEFPPSITN